MGDHRPAIGSGGVGGDRLSDRSQAGPCLGGLRRGGPQIGGEAVPGRRRLNFHQAGAGIEAQDAVEAHGVEAPRLAHGVTQFES